MPDPLLTRRQVADYLGVHVNSLDKMRRTDPTFPRSAALSPRTLRWDPGQLRRWVGSKQTEADLAVAARALVAEVYR